MAGRLWRAFLALKSMDIANREAYNALLEYCKLDTLAMVKVLDKLMEVAEKG